MNFYYLREFSTEKGFDKLSIIERLILSAVLTKRLNNDDRDYVEIIMNFDGALNYTTYTNWLNYKDFAMAITNFLNAEKGHMSDYILNNCKERNIIHYVKIKYSDLAITHKHAMSTIACKAFILSSANHAANDNNDWFSFNLCQWSKSTMTHKKRSLQEIDSFMESHGINYAVEANRITIFNKRKQSKNEKQKNIVSSNTEKVKQEDIKSHIETDCVQNDPDASVNIDELLHTVNNSQVKNESEHVKESVKNTETVPVQTQSTVTPKKNDFDSILEEENIFNLIESHLSRKMIVEFNETHLNTYNSTIDAKYKDKFMKYIKALNKAMEIEDIAAVVNGHYISGEDGLNRKQEALCLIYNTQQKIIKALDKLYNEDKECYIEILKRIRTSKLLTFDTGITE